MKLIRLHILFDPGTLKMLDQMVKEAKHIYPQNGISRSKILGYLIRERDPQKTLRIDIKNLQVELRSKIERLDYLEESKEKSKVSGPSYKKEVDPNDLNADGTTTK